MVRFIELFRPLSRFAPSVKPPERRVPFSEKLFWTGIALVIYLIMASVPLYGVGKGGQADPFGVLRVIFASSRGTLMELGIGPIVTAGLILQILAGSKMINVDLSKPEDRQLFTSASKILAIFMTLFEASVFIAAGAFGPIPVQTQFVILLQLVAAGIVVILLDELLQKGWGIGSGISLFIAAGVAQAVVWDSISPVGPMEDGKNLGAIVAFIQGLYGGGPLVDTLYRTGGLPDMIAFIATVATFIIVIYINALRIDIPVSYAKYKGFRGRYPIKLLYTSNIPVIFAAALFGNVYFFAQLVWSRYNPMNNDFWLNLLGQFSSTGRQYQPTGGLVYYLVAPRSLSNVLQDPVRASVYVILFVAACVFFSVTWIEVGGMDPGTVAKQLIESGMQVEGFRRSEVAVRQLLERYIPTVAVLGGLIIGLIAVFADYLGAFGSGTGILLTVGILEQYYTLLIRERVTEIYPALKAVLGK